MVSWIDYGEKKVPALRTERNLFLWNVCVRVRYKYEKEYYIKIIPFLSVNEQKTHKERHTSRWEEP